MKSARSKKSSAPAPALLSEPLLPTSAHCERTFASSAGQPTLTVRSTLRTLAGPNDPISYRVAINRAEGAPTTPSYSLYTLCIQGRRWRVEITQASGESVAFIDAKGNVAKEITGIKQPVNLILARAQPKGAPGVDPAKVWSIAFAGDSCELWVTSYRPKVRKPKRPDDTDDSSDCPPPPESGGEDGDAE